MLFLRCLIRICLYEHNVQTERKCAIGPAIDYGFYYDFEFGFAFAEVESFMEQSGEDYKLEMIRELPESEKITFYRQGDYVEFCAGHAGNIL